MTQQICTSKGVAATHLQHVKVAAVAQSHSQKSLEHSIAVEMVMSEEREVARCRRQQADAEAAHAKSKLPAVAWRHLANRGRGVYSGSFTTLNERGSAQPVEKDEYALVSLLHLPRCV